jgi:phosphatidylglycerophosphatase A
LLPDEILMQVAGFLLFRFFDIVKPPPIRQFDARLKGGFGVMFDDLLAAGFTLVLLLGWERL